jgi:hypothetical protein
VFQELAFMASRSSPVNCGPLGGGAERRAMIISMTQDERSVLQGVVDELLALSSHNDDLMRAAGGVLVRLVDVPTAFLQKCQEAAEKLACDGLEAPELLQFLSDPNPAKIKPLVAELRGFCLEV